MCLCQETAHYSQVEKNNVLTGAFKKVLALEEVPPVNHLGSWINVADGNLVARSNLLQRADSKLAIFEEDMSIGIARVVDHSRDEVESISNGFGLVRATNPHTVCAQLYHKEVNTSSSVRRQSAYVLLVRSSRPSPCLPCRQWPGEQPTQYR